MGSKILVWTERSAIRYIQDNMKVLSLPVQNSMLRLIFFKSRSKLEVKVTGQFFSKDTKVLPQGISMHNMKAWFLSVQKLMPKLSFFSKVGQKSRSRSQGQNF